MSAEIRKQRLRRLDVVFVRSPIYFLTACMENRRNLLPTPAIHETFLRFGNEGPLHGAWIGVYVIMPDHLHLFVATDDEKIAISAWMKSLKNTISKTLGANRIAPPHWQKTFFDHLLRSNESYSEK
ncbi:MAG TPA: transposase [Candidatus Udaeobacter sp.]|nr:transposase [Candidatus Udaeobacter sp.]